MKNLDFQREEIESMQNLNLPYLLEAHRGLIETQKYEENFKIRIDKLTLNLVLAMFCYFAMIFYFKNSIWVTLIISFFIFTILLINKPYPYGTSGTLPLFWIEHMEDFQTSDITPIEDNNLAKKLMYILYDEIKSTNYTIASNDFRKKLFNMFNYSAMGLVIITMVVKIYLFTKS